MFKYKFIFLHSSIYKYQNYETVILVERSPNEKKGVEGSVAEDVVNRKF